MPGSTPKKLRPNAIPSLHLPTPPDAEPPKVFRKTRCAVVGCQPNPKDKRHPVPNNTHGGKRDPRRDYWLMVCGVDPDDERADLRVCGKHFDQIKDYNPKSGRLKTSAFPTLHLPGPGNNDEEEEEEEEQEELMEIGGEDDLPDDNIAEAISSISLAEESDSSEEEMNDGSGSNHSSDREESEIELDDVEQQLEDALGVNLELKMKLKIALQRARRQSGRLAELEMPRKKDMEKYLLQNYSHAWDVSISPFSFIPLQVLAGDLT